MNANETALLDPFDVSTPDEATELTALSRALELAEGFSLIFVRCNQIPQRERLMEEVRARLPKLNIQTLFFREPVPHLLDAMQAQLTTPLPNAVFVSGLEFSLPVAAEASAAPLIANLNASRNSFAQTLPCPVVLWVPEYVLTAIAQGAPDFFSIRSGVYFFAAKPAELAHLSQNLFVGKLWEIESLSLREKHDRIDALERLLADYELLPATQQDGLTKLRLLRNLEALFFAQGDYDKSLIYTKRSLREAEDLDDNVSKLLTLQQIGLVHQARGNYDAALDCYQLSLKFAEDFGISEGRETLFHQIGNVQYLQANYAAALDYYQRSLKIADEVGNLAGQSSTLHQMGLVQQALGNYKGALDYYQRSLKIAEDVGNIAGVAASLHEIGILEFIQGNYAAALGYYHRSLKIGEGLGDVAGAAGSQAQIGQLLTVVEHYQDAFRFLLKAWRTLTQIGSSNADIALDMLRDLRSKWSGFDTAWREATGGAVPAVLLEAEGVQG